MKMNWTHKVVKRQRGTNGEWFSYPAAATFCAESDARVYAARFADDQRGVGGTRIVVQTRGRRIVAVYPVR